MPINWVSVLQLSFGFALFRYDFQVGCAVARRQLDRQGGKRCAVAAAAFQLNRANHLRNARLNFRTPAPPVKDAVVADIGLHIMEALAAWNISA